MAACPKGLRRPHSESEPESPRGFQTKKSSIWVQTSIRIVTHHVITEKHSIMAVVVDVKNVLMPHLIHQCARRQDGGLPVLGNFFEEKELTVGLQNLFCLVGRPRVCPNTTIEETRGTTFFHDNASLLLLLLFDETSSSCFASSSSSVNQPGFVDLLPVLGAFKLTPNTRSDDPNKAFGLFSAPAGRFDLTAPFLRRHGGY